MGDSEREGRRMYEREYNRNWVVALILLISFISLHKKPMPLLGKGLQKMSW